jgi:hypothetical protein
VVCVRAQSPSAYEQRRVVVTAIDSIEERAADGRLLHDPSPDEYAFLPAKHETILAATAAATSSVAPRRKPTRWLSA